MPRKENAMSTMGIPYFPLDVHLNDKIRLIEANFSLTGFGIIVKLYQRIYGEQGYYIEWTKDVALLFAQDNCVGGSVVSEIVIASIQRGIFDKTLYEKYRILTSKGIQERYFEIVKRRKEVRVKGEYLLINAANLPQNVVILSKNANINEENVNIFKQSKVKERKEKYSKEKNGLRPAQNKFCNYTDTSPPDFKAYEEQILREMLED